MPRTLLLTEIFPPKTGGSGRWFHEIYSRLPRDEFAILAGNDPAAAAFDATHNLRLARADLTLPAWGIRSLAALRGYSRLVRTLRAAIRREGIERLHVGRCLPEGWAAWLVRRVWGVPYSCYVHGEDVETAATSRELAWMVRRVLGSADRLIANSHNTARLLRVNWSVPAGRIAVLHPGCDASRFVPAPRNAEVRRRLGWDDRPVILTVGRLQKRKGQDVLIRALACVREAVPNVLYAIVGDGEERGALERLVADERLGRHVQLLGEIDDHAMIDCYQQCDLFALPNRQVGRDIEGFGMVLVEAQACGRPVIAGASGGTAETMIAGRTGYVVPCDGPDELAPALARLLLDPAHRAEMGRAAREWAAGRFDWTSLAREAETLFADGPLRAGDVTTSDAALRHELLPNSQQSRC